LGQGEGELRHRGFASDNVITFDHGSDPDAFAAVFVSLLDAYHLPVGSDKNFGVPGDLSRESKGKIKFDARGKVFVDREVDSSGGDIASFAVVGFRWPVQR